MTHFEPLGYVAASISTWHIVIGIAILALLGIVIPAASGEPIRLNWLAFCYFSILATYAIFMLLFGQVFGDKYPFGKIWPSGFVLGAMFSATPFLGLTSSSGETASNPPAWFIAFGMFVGANFFAFALWLLPRMVGFGLIELPKFSWGVRLLP